MHLFDLLLAGPKAVYELLTKSETSDGCSAPQDSEVPSGWRDNDVLDERPVEGEQ